MWDKIKTGVCISGLTVLSVMWSYLQPLQHFDVDSLSPKREYVKQEHVRFYPMVAAILVFSPFLVYTLRRVGKKPGNFGLAATRIYMGLAGLNLTVNVIKWCIGKKRPDYDSRLLTGDHYVIMDGRRSFPSGHSGTAVLASFFLVSAALSCIKKGPRLNAPRMIALVLAIVLSVCGALYVCASRMVDNRHDIVDVCGGALIGCFIGFLLVNRAGRKK